MLRSQPPPLLHVSQLFNYDLDVSPRCSEINDDVQSVHSTGDDESVASAELCTERCHSNDVCEVRREC